MRAPDRLNQQVVKVLTRRVALGKLSVCDSMKAAIVL
jgi:hypothetical protein